MSRVVLLVLSLLISGLARAQPSSDLAPRRAAAPFDRTSRLLARGQLLRDAGDSISALAYFRDAVAAAPREPQGYVALGSLYLELDEPLRALEVFETGARLAQRGEGLWLGLARTLQKLGQDARALEALRTLRSTDPTGRAGLTALAEATESRGSFIEALGARRALLALLAGEPPGDDREAMLNEQRARVRALELLIGGAERVRARSVCNTGEPSPVRRALAACP